ncbi:MAG: LysE family translocator, partial [Desulfobacteraceae bacterium]
MSMNFILLYATTIFIASIIPGPSMLLALTHGMQFGARKTIASALGNLTVTIIQALISIAGLGTILITSEIAFHVFKYAGAAYLVYIGIRVFISQGISITSIDNKFRSNTPYGRLYSQAALVTAGNPKAIVFFTAVFPQFIDPSASYLPQSCILLSIGSVVAFSCFMLYAISGQKIVFLFSKASIG